MTNLHIHVWEPVESEDVTQGLIVIRLGVSPEWPFEDDVLDELRKLWLKALTRESVSKEEFETATERLCAFEKQPNIHQALEVIKDIRAKRRAARPQPQTPAIEGRTMTPALRDELLEGRPIGVQLLMRGILSDSAQCNVKFRRSGPVRLHEAMKPPIDEKPTEEQERRLQLIREQAEASKRLQAPKPADQVSDREHAALDRHEANRLGARLPGSKGSHSFQKQGGSQ